MKEYCKVVLSVGEKAGFMAKLVSDYTVVILKGIDETESEWSKVFNSQSPNAYKGIEYERSRYSGDLNKWLDANGL